jgi:hypothetical protein
MKVQNIINKIDKLREDNYYAVINVDIKTTPTEWGGFNVIMTGLVGWYYDFRIHEQIIASTEEEALNKFKSKSIEYFAAKPWHDENDLMSDYHAWNFYHRLKDLDHLVARAKEFSIDQHKPCRCKNEGQDDGDITCWKHHDCRDGSCTHAE